MTKAQAREQLRSLGLVLLNTYYVRVDPVDGPWYKAWTARATDESCSTNRVRFGQGTTEAEALKSLVENATQGFMDEEIEPERAQAALPLAL